MAYFLDYLFIYLWVLQHVILLHQPKRRQRQIKPPNVRLTFDMHTGGRWDCAALLSCPPLSTFYYNNILYIFDHSNSLYQLQNRNINFFSYFFLAFSVQFHELFKTNLFQVVFSLPSTLLNSYKCCAAHECVIFLFQIFFFNY